MKLQKIIDVVVEPEIENTYHFRFCLDWGGSYKSHTLCLMMFVAEHSDEYKILTEHGWLSLAEQKYGIMKGAICGI